MGLNVNSNQKILDKIKKCFALTSSSFEEEADTALRTARRLMNEHGISMADIEYESKTGKIKEGGIVYSESTKEKVYKKWEYVLFGVVKNLATVRIVSSRKRGSQKQSFQFAGTPSDVGLAREIYAILCYEIKKLSKLHRNNIWEKDSFRLGVCLRLASMSAIIKRENETPIRTPEGLSCQDLMISKEMQIKKFFQEESITESQHEVEFDNSCFSFRAGYTEGSKINLNFQKQIK